MKGAEVLAEDLELVAAYADALELLKNDTFLE